MKLLRCITSVTILILIITKIILPQTIYVSPTGNIYNEGTINSPLPSFSAAVDKIRKMKSGKDDVTVLFRGGTYLFSETVELTNNDLGNNNKQIIFKAYQGEAPIFTSGVKIDGWRKIDSSDLHYKFLPYDSRKNVYVADIPKYLSSIHHLVDKKNGWLKMGKINVTKYVITEKYIHGKSVEGQMWDPPEEKKICNFSKSMNGLSNADNALIFSIYTADFELQLLPVEKIEGNIIITATPGGHRLALPDEGQKHGSTNLAYLHNLIEGIDSQGKFAFYPESNRIYLWPNGSLDQIYVPSLNELIRIEGVAKGKEAWFSNDKENPIQNIIFDGITFSNCKQPVWLKGDMAAQHDWAMLDKDNALLRFRGAQNCVVRNCTFEKSGGVGLAFDLYAQNNRIENNLFQYLGYEGIRIAGYGIGFKDDNKNNLISGNEFHNVNKIHHYGAALVLWNTGFNTIIENYFHHFASRAILFSAPRSRAFTKNNQTLFPSDRVMREQAWPMARWFEIPDSALARIYYAIEEEDGQKLDIRRVEVNGNRQGERGGLIADRTCSFFRYLRGNIVERNLIGYGAEELFADGIFYITGCASGEPNRIRNNYIFNTGVGLPLPNIPFRLIYIDGYTGKFEFSQNYAFNCKFRFEVTAMYNWWDRVDSYANIFYNVEGEEYGDENICIGSGPNNTNIKYLNEYKSMLDILNRRSFSQVRQLPGKEKIINELERVINSY